MKKTTNFANEFNIYENMFAGPSKEKQRQALKESCKRISKKLTEGTTRSAAEIEQEIARLQQELAQAKIAEKKATYTDMPKEVYIWDIYLTPNRKGTWTSAELYNGKWDGFVYETADEAEEGGWGHLYELDNEGELRYDPDDYYVEAVAIPLADVQEETLRFSDLDHLI